jgi:hypothetical protein
MSVDDGSDFGRGVHGDDDTDMISLRSGLLGSEMRGNGRGDAEGTQLDFVEEDDVRRMGKAWVWARGTGELGRWEGDLIDSLFHKLEQQVSPSLASSYGTRHLLCGKMTSAETNENGKLERTGC